MVVTLLELFTGCVKEVAHAARRYDGLAQTTHTWTRKYRLKINRGMLEGSTFWYKGEAHRELYGTMCDCSGPCDTTNPACVCISKWNFCETFCACGPACKNRYRGCKCKS